MTGVDEAAFWRWLSGLTHFCNISDFKMSLYHPKGEPAALQSGGVA